MQAMPTRLLLCLRPRLQLLLFLIFGFHAAFGEVFRVEIQRRDDAGTHERLIGRVFFRVDPALPANRDIATLDWPPGAKTAWFNFRAASCSSSRKMRGRGGERYFSKSSIADGISRWP